MENSNGTNDHKADKEKVNLDMKDPGTEKINLTPTWRHHLMFLVFATLVYGGTINGLTLNEWVQMMIRKEHNPNGTESFSGCGGEFNATEEQSEELRKVQQAAAQWTMLFALSVGVPNTIVTLFLPSYTDALGRKFLIVLTITGMAIDNIVTTVTIYYEGSFWYIFASHVFMGFTGSFFSLLSAAFAMVADLTHTENQRTIGIVVLDVFILFPSILASYCSGLFIEDLEFGFLKTSIIATCVATLSMLLSFCIEESHLPSKRSKRQTLWHTVRRMTDFYISDEFKQKRKGYMFLLLGFGFATLAQINRGGMETLYFLGEPFCWGPSKIGTFSMTSHASKAIIGLGSLKLLQMCMSNANIGVLSTLTNAGSFFIEAFATTTLMIYMVPVSGMFSFLVIPMIRSLLSAITDSDRQGAVFASVAVIEVICELAAKLSQNTIYSYTMSFMNGFVFIICGSLSLVNMLLMILFSHSQQSMENQGISGELIHIPVDEEKSKTDLSKADFSKADFIKPDFNTKL